MTPAETALSNLVELLDKHQPIVDTKEAFQELQLRIQAAKAVLAEPEWPSWTVEIRLHPELVESGLNFSDPSVLEEALWNAFPLARMSHFKVAVLMTPDQEAASLEPAESEPEH